MSEYKSFEEWQQDMEIFKKHPNDVEFLAHVAKRVRISKPEIRDKIQDKIAEDMFEKDPFRYMVMLANQTEGKYPVIKSKDDIWFEV